MITAIIPTLNEQDFIEEAIASVSFADEIIVIDSYSTDRTVELAKKHKVKIVLRKFDNFSSQKNFAIDLASHDWIYVLDADERVSPKLKEEILYTVDHPKDCVAFFIYRTLYFKDKKVKYGGWQTDKVIRLFQKAHCRYDGKLVHERIKYDGKIGFLKNKIDHYSYRDFKQYAGKLNFYAYLQARELMQGQRNIHFGHRWLKSRFRFMVHYMIRLGFLDGEKGLTLAKLHAKAVDQRYVEYDRIKGNSIISSELRIKNKSK